MGKWRDSRNFSFAIAETHYPEVLAKAFLRFPRSSKLMTRDSSLVPYVHKKLHKNSSMVGRCMILHRFDLSNFLISGCVKEYNVDTANVKMCIWLLGWAGISMCVRICSTTLCKFWFKVIWLFFLQHLVYKCNLCPRSAWVNWTSTRGCSKTSSLFPSTRKTCLTKKTCGCCRINKINLYSVYHEGENFSTCQEPTTL